MKLNETIYFFIGTKIESFRDSTATSAAESLNWEREELGDLGEENWELWMAKSTWKDWVWKIVKKLKKSTVKVKIKQTIINILAEILFIENHFKKI